MVLWTATAVCDLDQLPWILLLRSRPGRTLSLLFLLQFSDRLARSNRLGSAQPPNDDIGTDSVGRGLIHKSRGRQDGSLPVKHHAGSSYEVQPGQRMAATAVQ